MLKRALEITGRSQAAGIRGELAWLYAKEGNKVDAEKILLDGISPAKPQNGNVAGQDDSVWFTLLQLAEQYKAEGRIQEAEDCYNRAIAIPETDPKAVAFLDQALDELGDLYESEGRDQEAENLFLRALNLREQSATPKRPDFAGLLSFPFALLNLYRGLGRLSEMEPIFQRALAIQEHVLGLDDARVGETLIQLARIYREEAKNAQALPLYQRSVEFAENNLSADDPRLTFLLKDYAGLLDEVGQKAQAARMRARADQASARNPQR